MKKYFKVTDKTGHSRIIEAYDKPHAISIAIGLDNNKYETSTYKASKERKI